ncbi:hypothetical protein [Heyndrickxia acidicola]|uniref:Uncharacterized protein n=1 Tax=Heyndrickxia acidicola TaxID=209389 RepID=A0ABU6MLN4_9BACI|nr:hypothetical protein [Heyndrickxia acidicola]MED1205602.1 hypothetical protein [Heyndrickxia acidicola]
MNEFNKALDQAISSFSKLSEEWGKLDESNFEKLNKKYPFDKDFTEVILDLLEWKKEINK